MTNLDKLKNDVNKMTAKEMAKRINKYLDDDACELCAYDKHTCSGEDCEYGIEKYLESDDLINKKIAGKRVVGGIA